MNQLIKRLTLKSPSFFVKIQNIGVGLIAFAGGIKLLATQYEGSRIIEFLMPYTTDIAVAGGIAALIAKLTVKPEVPNYDLTANAKKD